MARRPAEDWSAGGAQSARLNDLGAVDAALTRLRRFHALFQGVGEIEKQSGLTEADVGLLIARLDAAREMIFVRRSSLDGLAREVDARERAGG